ncbi:MAG: hypothetical protein ACKO5C_04235 [Ferruginibacter sp.]
MKQILALVILIASMLLFNSCEKGCTDPKALNYKVTADKNDGSCQFSTATFYASAGFFNGVPINRIDLSIEGSGVGTINTIYPAGPGNCSAPGTVIYQFENSSTVDWNTVVYLNNGQTLFGSGTASPSSINACVKVNVTQ